MKKSPKRLGRGLSSLIGNPLETAPPQERQDRGGSARDGVAVPGQQIGQGGEESGHPQRVEESADQANKQVRQSGKRAVDRGVRGGGQGVAQVARADGTGGQDDGFGGSSNVVSRTGTSGKVPRHGTKGGKPSGGGGGTVRKKIGGVSRERGGAGGRDRPSGGGGVGSEGGGKGRRVDGGSEGGAGKGARGDGGSEGGRTKRAGAVRKGGAKEAGEGSDASATPMARSDAVTDPAGRRGDLVANATGLMGEEVDSTVDGGVEVVALASWREGAVVEARTVPLDALRPNRHQPRGAVDEEGCRALARSIATSGVIQPIVVRRTEGVRPGDARFEIVAGERRWRAARLAGVTSVPVLVREATDEQMLELALVENIHREDLNAVDRALAYRRYCETFGLKADEVASRLGEDRTTVTNYIRLLELPEAVLSLLAGGAISMGHARALLGARSPEHRVELAEAAAEGGMSVRTLEALVRRGRSARKGGAGEGAGRGGAAGVPIHLKDLERRFEEVLGTKVTIQLGESRTAGRVVIEFFSVDDFERICLQVGVIPSDEG